MHIQNVEVRLIMSIGSIASSGIVLSLYDLSGIMVRPWAEVGYECFIVDIQHPRGCTAHPDIPNTWRWGVDIMEWLPPKVDYRIAFSFAPCDDTAVSGRSWFKSKGLYSLGNSIRMFARGMDICRWSGAPYLCEHPKSVIVTHMDRRPDHIFHPHHFNWATSDDDNYTKETYIWSGNGLIWPRQISSKMPDKKRICNCPNTKDRKNICSKTPDGFARAVFMANTGVEGTAEVEQPYLFHQESFLGE
jgi:hypothetical protein